MIIRCVIVEDEPASQEVLRKYIADMPVLELVSVCSNAIEANTIIRNHNVDVMFLDINMPRMSGLDFYKSLTNPPRVIFTTAYPEYAVSGFEVNAVDYLVKPFSFERFVKAVNKFQDALVSSETQTSDFIMLNADKKMHKVNLDDILYIEGMGDYVKVHTKLLTVIVHTTLQKIQQELPPRQFYRIHKSYLISLQHLNFIEGNMAIVNKQGIPIGQTYRNEFLTMLQKKP
jgi:DNA-binding LytR/AlgR family response regulator